MILTASVDRMDEWLEIVEILRAAAVGVGIPEPERLCIRERHSDLKISAETNGFAAGVSMRDQEAGEDRMDRACRLYTGCEGLVNALACRASEVHRKIMGAAGDECGWRDERGVCRLLPYHFGDHAPEVMS